MEVTRVLTIQLNPNKEQTIVLGHLTYSASKLWNVANYKVANKQVKLNQLKQTLKQDFWYKNLHSQSAQAVLEKLQIAWETATKNILKDQDTNLKMDTSLLDGKNKGLSLKTIG